MLLDLFKTNLEHWAPARLLIHKLIVPKHCVRTICEGSFVWTCDAHHALCGLQAGEGVCQQHGHDPDLSHTPIGAIREPTGKLLDTDPHFRAGPRMLSRNLPALGRCLDSASYGLSPWIIGRTLRVLVQPDSQLFATFQKFSQAFATFVRRCNEVMKCLRCLVWFGSGLGSQEIFGSICAAFTKNFYEKGLAENAQVPPISHLRYSSDFPVAWTLPMPSPQPETIENLLLCSWRVSGRVPWGESVFTMGSYATALHLTYVGKYEYAQVRGRLPLEYLGCWKVCRFVTALDYMWLCR